MKFTTSLFALTGFVGVVFADAPIKNSGVSADITVPDSYIVTYKASASSSNRKKHEQDITKKAQGKGKEGVVDTINLDGFHGYVAQIPPSELKEVVQSDLVSHCPNLEISLRLRLKMIRSHISRRIL